LSNFIPINGIKPCNQNGTLKKLLLCNLCHLDLAFNKLRDEGAFLLDQFLKSPNCHLIYLALEGCPITNVGYQALTKANSEQKNSVRINLIPVLYDTSSDDDNINKDNVDVDDNDIENIDLGFKSRLSEDTSVKEDDDLGLKQCLFDDISDKGDDDIEMI